MLVDDNQHLTDRMLVILRREEDGGVEDRCYSRQDVGMALIAKNPLGEGFII